MGSYVIDDVSVLGKDKFSCVINKYRTDEGQIKLIHNELYLEFNIDKELNIHPIFGWHIGTEDFTFSRKEDTEEGCLHYIETYNSGLINQLKEEIIKFIPNTKVRCSF